MNTKQLILTALFVALTAISAFIKVPFPLIPLTFQLIVAVASGIFLGSKFGALSQIIYIVLGLIGFPIFSEGGGFTYILKPTFGFLLSFPLASMIAGYFWKHTLFQKSIGIFMAIFCTYFVGVPFLWISTNWVMKSPITFMQAVNFGFWPFIIKDITLGIVLFIVALPVTKYLDSKESEILEE